MGRAVRKAFPGFGTYAGVVESYDPGAGYFRVLYEDGDSEEVDADEMAQILVGPAMPRAQQQRTSTQDAAGRRPKKRRRGDEDDPSPTSTPDGVVLAVAAAAGEETEPATPVMEAAAEKKPRVSPGPESSRPLRRSARQAKAAEMEAAASNHRQELASLEPKPRGTTPTTFPSPMTRSSPPPPRRARTPMTMRATRRSGGHCLAPPTKLDCNF